MSAEPQQLRAGRERAQRLHRREATKRVRAYERWLKSGQQVRSMPDVPSSADYRIVYPQGLR